MRGWLLIVVGLLSCGGPERRPHPPEDRGEAKAAKDKEEEDRKRLHKLGRPVNTRGVDQTATAPRTVVLIVTDTVRADHLSLCGYSRPTSPNLQTMAQNGMSYTCHAYAPGTWTLPSHASYFTGLYTTEHHLLNKGVPLDPGIETLAEIFARQGYQTAMLSANPTLTKPSGLWQGFSVVNVPKGTTDEFRLQRFDDQLAKTMKGLNPDKPLFLVVNIFDAHDPYPDVPGDVPWLPRQQGLQINPEKEEADGPAHRFVEGKMPAGEAKKFVERIRNGYDYGINRADRNVQKTAQVLEEGGWLDEGYRIVITSDHGEHLGEHSLVRHDGPPWESVTRVFTMFKDTTATAPLVFPEPFANTMVFWLVKDGALPDPLLPVASASIHYESAGPEHARQDSVALWLNASDKLWWAQGPFQRFNLKDDPGEERPLALPADDAHVGDMEERKAALLQSKAVALGKGKDPEMMKTLEAIGYVN